MDNYNYGAPPAETYGAPPGPPPPPVRDHHIIPSPLYHLLIDDFPQVPEGWKAQYNNQYNEWFYVNLHTKQSQWEKPTHPALPPESSHSPPPGPPPGYGGGRVSPYPEDKSHLGTNNPYASQHGSSSQQNLGEDERLARQLQAEEDERSRVAGVDRGQADTYYGAGGAGAGVPGGQQPYGGGYPPPQQQSPYGGPSGYPPPQQPNYDQQALPPRQEKKGGLSGLLGKLGGKHGASGSHGGGYPQQHGYPPQQHGYGGGGFGRPPRRGGGMGPMGAGALGLGGGLAGGALLGSAMHGGDDGGDYGGDDGGGYGGDDGGGFGGDDGGGDFGGGGGDFGGGDGGGGGD